MGLPSRRRLADGGGSCAEWPQATAAEVCVGCLSLPPPSPQQLMSGSAGDRIAEGTPPERHNTVTKCQSMPSRADRPGAPPPPPGRNAKHIQLLLKDAKRPDHHFMVSVAGQPS